MNLPRRISGWCGFPVGVSHESPRVVVLALFDRFLQASGLSRRRHSYWPQGREWHEGTGAICELCAKLLNGIG
jgi:hypothetical protein